MPKPKLRPPSVNANDLDIVLKGLASGKLSVANRNAANKALADLAAIAATIDSLNLDKKNGA